MQDIQQTLELLVNYIKGIWVKKRYVIISTWLICPIGFFYVLTLPNVYQSQARVYVDTRSVLQPLLRGLAIQTNPQQEIAMMVKTLLSRPNLEIIARESDLDITATTAEAYSSLIDSMSKNIKLNSAGRDNLYTISYSSTSPEIARTVVQETLNLFVENSKGNSRKDSDSANQFIDEQINDYENRLSAAETRLANFKRKYSDLLPNQGSFYQNYAQLQESLEATLLTIKEIQQQIVALKSNNTSQKPNVDEFSVHHSNSLSPLTTRYDVRIKNLEENLDELMLKYTELHPDVIEAQNLLASLKTARKSEIEEYLASSSNTDEANSQVGSVASEIKLEVSRLESQIASLKVRQNNYEAKIQVLAEKIDLVPQVEAERTALDRDYQVTKRKYEELLSRKESSDLAQKAEASNEDVQFRVIDPPRANNKASGPNRPLLYTLVLIVAFGAGFGVAFLLSQINPILIRPNQLTQLTGYPVLGVVSHLNKAKMKKVARKRLFIFLLSSGMNVGAYGVLIAADIMKIDIYARIFS
ncbi:GNVR domain-containing protein [Paraglaciecola aquimarina]|uniref:GNVR domain-containing protein n=1 Tax=Paraglaciecola aquimarina TaxID=1235557 RepID=A0ABU3T287_9ALTE|nr:XrtA system polysaccharide chain length determinant [Paraglaciecola aquimarina]MDU0356384.1 GNVR domain-containing protein [Paraglaciecola aquimarina]